MQVHDWLVLVYIGLIPSDLVYPAFLCPTILISNRCTTLDAVGAILHLKNLAFQEKIHPEYISFILFRLWIGGAWGSFCTNF